MIAAVGEAEGIRLRGWSIPVVLWDPSLHGLLFFTPDCESDALTTRQR